MNGAMVLSIRKEVFLLIKRRIKLMGKFACFSRPESKIDRMSYPIPTPSALRNILEAIYFKPNEFRYEITGITVLKPIRYMDMCKNEIKVKANPETCQPIDCSKEHTQRSVRYLRDVAYLVDCRICLLDSFEPYNRNREDKIAGQFDRRVSNGKCFYQPYFGMRECMCFFEFPDGTERPDEGVGSEDFGLMLYDIFDPRTNGVLNTRPGEKSTAVIAPSYYYPVMRNGHIRVPDYMSDQVIRQEVM